MPSFATSFRGACRRRRHQGRRHRLERRQLLLGRRRPRHHRPAADARHEGAARLHAHDRRSRQGDARLPAAGHRGGRRRVRRRRRDDRALSPTCGIATPAARTAFLFARVGLAGCDMGACAMLPRVIGQGRAAELLFTGRTMSAEEGERWGFFNRLVAADVAGARGDRARRRASPRARPSRT